jgi:hypothetical protein
MTDDRGQFRIFDLPAGEYYVSATYASMPPTPGTAPSQGPATRVGFQLTYHPSATTIADARAVTVGMSEETAGVDIAMARGEVAAVSVVASDATGHPLSTAVTPDTYAILQLVSAHDPSVSFTLFGRGPRFSAAAVPHGEYRLIATVYEKMPSGAMRTREAAYLPVSLTGDVVDLPVRTNTGATIRGRVVLAPEHSVLPKGVVQGESTVMSHLTVSAYPTEGAFSGSGAFSSNRSATVGPDGTFELTGVRGPIVFRTSGPAVTTVRRGAKDITCAVLDVRGDERIDDIQIEVSTRLGSVDGTAPVDAKTLENGAWVIAVPVDADRCPARSFGVTWTLLIGPFPPVNLPTPPEAGDAGGQDRGRFHFGNLLPGRYAFVVVNREGTAPPLDASSLAKLSIGATIVTVAAAPVINVDLQRRQ